MITEAVEDLAANGMRRRCCMAVHVRWASQSKRGELALPPAWLQLQGPGAIRRRSGLLGWHSPSKSPKYVHHTGWTVTLAILAPRSILAGAELCFGCKHAGVVSVFEPLAKPFVKGGCAAAARVWRTGSPKPKPPFLMEDCARDQAPAEIPCMILPRQFSREVCDQ